jgi:hypothetical protein
MKALVPAKLLLVFILFAAWSDAALAQNASRRAVTQADNGLGLPSASLSRSRQASGQYQTICHTDRGTSCSVSSNLPILQDAICHCGPNPGATIGGSQ